MVFPRVVNMSLRSIFMNILGLVFIAFCFYLVAGHIRYLNKSVRPSREAIGEELDLVAEAFQGSRSSSVEIFDKKSVYISARVDIKLGGGKKSVLNGRRRLEAGGWRKVVVAYGNIERFCKGDLVAEVTPLDAAGSYTLQVNWGNADAVCKFK
jgi:hypothetical protein